MRESAKIRNSLTPEDRKGGKTAYDLVPAETRAREEVRQVMIERGLVYTAPVCPLDVTTEDREWAAPYLRERAERAFANNAVPHPKEGFDSISLPSSTISTPELEKQPILNSPPYKVTILLN